MPARCISSEPERYVRNPRHQTDSNAARGHFLLEYPVRMRRVSIELWSSGWLVQTILRCRGETWAAAVAFFRLLSVGDLDEHDRSR